jgi:hypothetical protein
MGPTPEHLTKKYEWMEWTKHEKGLALVEKLARMHMFMLKSVTCDSTGLLWPIMCWN